jgi:hypothetical protein
MAELVEIRAGVVEERLATEPASERVSRTILRRFYLVETLARIARTQRAFRPSTVPSSLPNNAAERCQQPGATEITFTLRCVRTSPRRPFPCGDTADTSDHTAASATWKVGWRCEAVG